MVVCADPEHDGKLRVCTQADDRSGIVVISGAGDVEPGAVLKQPGPVADGAHPVAMIGRADVLADARFGGIKPGDELTRSTNPGHAMKVNDDARANRAVLGTARSEEGKGLVLVAIQRR